MHDWRDLYPHTHTHALSRTHIDTTQVRLLWECFSYPDVVLCAMEGPMGQKGMYSWLWTYRGASVRLGPPQPHSW